MVSLGKYLRDTLYTFEALPGEALRFRLAPHTRAAVLKLAGEGM
jgi:hypothetical protein